MLVLDSTLDIKCSISHGEVYYKTFFLHLNALVNSSRVYYWLSKFTFQAFLHVQCPLSRSTLMLCNTNKKEQWYELWSHMHIWLSESLRKPNHTPTPYKMTFIRSKKYAFLVYDQYHKLPLLCIKIWQWRSPGFLVCFVSLFCFVLFIWFLVFVCLFFVFFFGGWVFFYSFFFLFCLACQFLSRVDRCRVSLYTPILNPNKVILLLPPPLLVFSLFVIVILDSIGQPLFCKSWIRACIIYRAIFFFSNGTAGFILERLQS